MVITVYGPGCARCHETERVIRNVLAQLEADADLQTVTDYKAMAAAGVMTTPAVGIDGVIKLAGRIPKPDDVKAWLQQRVD
jgi:small redox-active disulfide protein 2